MAKYTDQRINKLLYSKAKLESVKETSAILGGFATVALVEFSIDTYPDVPSGEGVLTAYGIISCLLIGVHLCALLMSVCILPEVKNALQQRTYLINNPDVEPLSGAAVYIEIAWILSTACGLFLILLELALVFWIKVAGFSIPAAIAAIATLSIVGVPFIIFCVAFYLRIIRAKVGLHQRDLESVERGAFRNMAFLHTSSTTTSVVNINENR